MNASTRKPIVFPPIERHGLIGDRRTGALVAADGTLDWFCAPDFDGTPIFGALLDPEVGGFCRLGPETVALGEQRYLKDTTTLITAWPNDGVQVSDVMAWPEAKRAPATNAQRVIIRHLQCGKETDVAFELRPRRNFDAPSEVAEQTNNGALFRFAEGTLAVWTSFLLETDSLGASARFRGHADDEHWVVVGWNAQPDEWSADRAAQVSEEAQSYWRDWSTKLEIKNAGDRTEALRRSALSVQLLSHAKHDSAVAALTTSLPERLGGDRNYDYRYAWVRDASLALALLARMGRVEEVHTYLDWLSALPSTTNAPLQVCYRIDGNPHLEQEKIAGVRGYKDSLPVHRGNRAATQIQLGAMGFFADCARIYVDEGGEWREEFWQLLKRAADFTCEHWREKGNGIWELPEEKHYVSSRVLSWVTLQRAIHIAQKTGHRKATDHWPETAAKIHDEVMEKGWCEEKKSFRQRYGSDALDASALLIPLMEFLPIDHPRVTATLAAIERELVVEGLLHRFDPADTLGGEQLPIGEFEGAFLPCVFWHAHTLAKAGRCDEAEEILDRCEKISGPTGLFAEEIDSRSDTFLGNSPLLFAHVEYVRAVVELNLSRARATYTR
ncbi:MAG TPA: glycoside hydrolase family 15 protein [Chthoniobacterales bacterium]|nr:glycoside hydrolase family 15 protein [Chthoniobacterales bacterium]